MGKEAPSELSLQAEIRQLRKRIAELQSAFQQSEEQNRRLIAVEHPATNGLMSEDALSRNQRTFSELIERAPFGIYVVDSRFRIAHMNAASQAGAFRNVRPIIGRDFAETMHILWPEPVAAEIIGHFRNTLETGEPYYSPRFFNLRRDVEAVEGYEWELHRMVLPDGQHGVVCYYFDSTKLREAESALRESEERYRELFESIDQGFCTIEVLFDENENPVDYRFLMVNPVFEKQTGISNAVGRRMREIAPLHEEHWFRIYGRIALTGEPMRFENPAAQLQRYYEVFAWKIGAPAERKVAILFNDISHRRQAEEALRASEEQFRTLANAIPQLCWMANGDGWIFWYNQRWYDYTGTTPEQMRGWGWQSVHHPETLPKVMESWKSSIATGEPFDMVFPLRGADGVFRPFLTRVMPVRDRDGKVIRWFGTNTDISEQRKTEEKLKRHAELLRLSLDAILTWELDGVIESWNLGAERLYGFTEPEALGRISHELLKTVFPEPRAEVLGALRESGFWEGELRHYTRDDREVIVLARLQVIRDGSGVERVLEINRDITERKRVETHMHEAQKLESLGLMAGGVAHDFNNLLVGIIGNASLVQEMLPPDHPVAELIARVVKTGEQAAHLTRQMLAYSGKGKFLVESLNVSVLARDIIELVRPSIPKKTPIRLELEDGLPAIEADRGQVQQILMNLAINAAEAIGSRDGLITVRTGTRSVDDNFVRRHPEAADLQPGQYVVLEVSDTGCGMDEALRARVFDPFFSTKFTGRGLGLAAVAGIVRGHKGAIVVTSAPGQGSTFSVLFPPAAHTPEKSPEAAALDAASQGSGVVLVIDDEQFVLDMAKRALEHRGYSVLVADGAVAAIDILKRYPGRIDMALLDLSMPGMSGDEALPELRKLRPEMKVLISSGYNEAEAMTMFAGQKVFGFIQKPYTSASLAEKVQRALKS